MINIHILRNKDGNIYSFKIENHGKRIVCAAVSALTLNVINSIEEFTDEDFVFEASPDGGYFMFEAENIKNNEYNSDVDLLLKSFFLGISGIKEEYKKHISIIEEVL